MCIRDRSSLEEVVFVTILNDNDNPPQFSEDLFEFKIPENSPLNVEISAIDEDLDQITFIPFSGFSPNFVLNSLTGVISSVQDFSLDYEVQQQFELVVEATDGLFRSYVNVTINVLDQNDLEPVFASPSYMSTINESLPVGSVILQVLSLIHI